METTAAQSSPAPLLLVVEDDKDLRESLLSILDACGFRVRGAAGGIEALRQLREAQGERPALLLLDLMMPGMDGWQFRTEQSRDTALRDIPVVMLSAVPPENARIPELQPASYLRKPVDLDVLLDTINHCLQR